MNELAMLRLISQRLLLITLQSINYPTMDVCYSYHVLNINNIEINFYFYFFIFSVRDDPQSLVILLNEEIVVIDLVTDSWPSYHLPYLNSIHASPVICTTLTCNVNSQFYKKLAYYATIQNEDYSDRVSFD